LNGSFAFALIKKFALSIERIGTGGIDMELVLQDSLSFDFDYFLLLLLS